MKVSVKLESPRRQTIDGVIQH